MDVETRLGLIKSGPLEEVITDEELRNLLETNSRPKHYIGFEISGMLHIGQVLMGGKKINDFNKAGIETQVLLADWHTMANNKLGGDWERIKKASEFYRKVFNTFCPGTKVVLGSDLYKGNEEYWKLLIQIARRATMARATRMLVIEGRSEKDTLHVSQYIYPIMQAADIWALDADLPHAGMDQRRIHVFAKDMFKEMKFKTIVPLHHYLMPSLLEPPKMAEGMSKEEQVAANKMSKSRPGSSISILANEEEVRAALKNAWCPVGVTEGNPVLFLCQHLIIPMNGKMHVERKKEYGGDVDYVSYAELARDFEGKKLHPVDLKNAAAASLIDIMEPIRRKFSGEREEILSMFTAVK
jgi:tyrosyl-tRNA synthetase